MIIRSKQFSALARVVEVEFAERLAQLLCEQFADARQMAPVELRRDISRLLPHAEAFGLTTERDAAAYVITAFVLGESFDKDFPEATKVLSSPVLNGADKSQWLEDWTTEMFRTLDKASQ